MEPVFWEKRWAADNIGFHSSAFNEFLLDYWPGLGVETSAGVFVPLCGKSLDLQWLSQRGHRVIGNEVVYKAVSAFFDEAGMTARKQVAGKLIEHRAGAITILHGDFFDLEPEHLQGATSWFDRAAQVALPSELRASYYAHLAELLPRGAIGLSLAFEYPQEQKQGPPFSVEEEEILDLCSGRFEVELLHRDDRLAKEPRLVEQGLTRASEAIYRMVRT
ncbi:MAG: thiopurine S-methyltransferase [Planctomycetota bacterium]|jgi:thiopurine S-methyltransferase